uniref:Putative secreted protein n=1 Tax=Anopheles darlingi TaxID=43151 RepID=A0A2M4D2M5_ANODA
MLLAFYLFYILLLFLGIIWFSKLGISNMPPLLFAVKVKFSSVKSPSRDLQPILTTLAQTAFPGDGASY